MRVIVFSGAARINVGMQGLGYILIKRCKGLTFDEPNYADSRIIALNAQIRGFHVRVVSAYAPTECDGSTNQKIISWINGLKVRSIEQNLDK